FVVDSSRRSTHGNAYFTGIGRHKRIVFFDTLLEQLAHPEVEAVLAHELGHFRLRHVRQRLLLSVALAFAGLALLGWLSRAPGFWRREAARCGCPFRECSSDGSTCRCARAGGTDRARRSRRDCECARARRSPPSRSPAGATREPRTQAAARASGPPCHGRRC